MRFLLPLALLVCAGECFAILLGSPRDAPFQITASGTASAASRAHDSLQTAREALIAIGDARSAFSTSSGSERSDCAGSERASQAKAKATASIFEKLGTYEVRVELDLDAQGGQRRGCASCMGTFCREPKEVDTKAFAEASTDLVFRIDFVKTFGGGSYQVLVKHEVDGSPIERRVFMSDSVQGAREVPNGESVTVTGTPGNSVRLSIKVKSIAGANGSCCREDKHTSFVAAVSITPAPDLSASIYATSMDIRTRRAETPSVGLLVARGDRGEPIPLCTGTVVARRTVLTAAHCLDYLQQRGEILFVPGADLRSGLKGAVQIVEAIRPTESSPSGFRYRFEDGRFVDDIALLYSREVIDVVPADLTPRSLTSSNSPLDARVVSFLALLERDTKFAGADARQVSWSVTVERRDARTAVARSQDGKVCSGTSGAPIMLHNVLVIGMLISGDSDCTTAQAVRIDAYWPWIAKRIR